jgi:hypothetical protein
VGVCGSNLSVHMAYYHWKITRTNKHSLTGVFIDDRHKRSGAKKVTELFSYSNKGALDVNA